MRNIHISIAWSCTRNYKFLLSATAPSNQISDVAANREKWNMRIARAYPGRSPRCSPGKWNGRNSEISAGDIYLFAIFNCFQLCSFSANNAGNGALTVITAPGFPFTRLVCISLRIMLFPSCLFLSLRNVLSHHRVLLGWCWKTKR